MIIIKSKLKNYIKDMNISKDFPQALEDKIKEIIDKAVERAKANGRRTVMARDL